MAFTTKWVQVWIPYPDPELPFIPSLLLWFETDIAIPGFWSPALFIDNVLHWFLDSVGQYCYSRLPHDRMGATIYYPFGTGIVRYSAVSTVGFEWPQGDVLPKRNCVVIQRLTNNWGRTQRGRFFLPGVLKTDVDVDALTPAAFARYSNVAPLLTNQILSQGITFSPILASYKDVTAIRLQKIIVNNRLGVVMRHARKRYPSYSINFVAKPIPV